MENDLGDIADQRSELHFLAALNDELMRALGQAGVLSREQLNAIEQAAANRVGGIARPW